MRSWVRFLLLSSSLAAALGCAIINRTPDTPTLSDRQFAALGLYKSAIGNSYRPHPSKPEMPSEVIDDLELFVQVPDYEDQVKVAQKRGYHMPTSVFVAAHEDDDPRKPQLFVIPEPGETLPGVTGKPLPLYRPGNRHFIADAWDYCRAIEQQSARASGQWAWIGIPAAGVGLPAAVAGTTLTVSESAKSDPSAGALAASAGLAAGGYVLSFLGAYALNRSSSGATASAQAGKGMLGDKPEDVYRACADARAAWLSSRTEAIDAVTAEREYWKKRAEAIAANAGSGGAGGAGGWADTGAGGSSGSSGVSGMNGAGGASRAGGKR